MIKIKTQEKQRRHLGSELYYIGRELKKFDALRNTYVYRDFLFDIVQVEVPNENEDGSIEMVLQNQIKEIATIYENSDTITTQEIETFWSNFGVNITNDNQFRSQLLDNLTEFFIKDTQQQNRYNTLEWEKLNH